jgi:GAF domain-containing protein
MKQSPLVLEDLHRETGFSGTLPMFRSRGLRSIAVLPMTTMGQPLGVIAFGSDKPSDFTNGAVHFLEQITGLVGLAISNLLTRQAVAGEEEQLRALTAVSIQLSERSIRAHQASAGRKGANGNDEPRNGLPQLETLDPQPKPAAYNPNSSLRRFV